MRGKTQRMKNRSGNGLDKKLLLRELVEKKMKIIISLNYCQKRVFQE